MRFDGAGGHHSPRLEKRIRGSIISRNVTGPLKLDDRPAFTDRHHHCQHPQIAIYLTPDRKITVSYDPGGEKHPKDTASSLVNTPEEAADYVDILMNRMPYDTDRVLAAIAKANERKQAYERTKTEPEH